MKRIVVAIDGFSSCGKSTLAKALAKELNYIFVDSGAMYRAITLFFLRNNIDGNNVDVVNNALKNISLDFSYNIEKGKSDMLLNNENVETEIREMAVSNKVSDVFTLVDSWIFLEIKNDFFQSKMIYIKEIFILPGVNLADMLCLKKFE